MSRTMKLIFIIAILFLPILACAEEQNPPAPGPVRQQATVSSTQPPKRNVQEEAPSETAESSSESESVPLSEEAEWLIMIYQNADDNTLEQDILIDLNEIEVVGSTPEIHMVAQTDRFEGGYDGMGNWTTAKRFYLTQDNDLLTIRSEELADLGEVNMADAQTLIDFITWAVETFPAQKHALILEDHGLGWPGGYHDPTTSGSPHDDLFLASQLGDNLWLLEIDQALGEAREQAGLDKFEVVGFDACLMGQLEVFNAMAPHAHYAVASEELEPGVGWAYTAFLQELAENPGMDGAELGQAIVETYIDQDQRVLASRGPRAIAQKLGASSTLAAIDLSQIAAINTALDELTLTLETLDQQVVAEVRTYTQSYVHIFGKSIPSTYIDLGHFATLLKTTLDIPEVQRPVDKLLAAIETAVVAERHGADRPGSTGIAIYFPVRKLYQAADNVGYRTVAERFVAETQWDEYLDKHFARTGRQVRFIRKEIGTKSISRSGEGMSLAPKPIQVAPLTLSSEIATEEQSVIIQTEVSGDQIGYIYSFVGRFLPHEDILIIEDQDFIFADENQTVTGVTYPLWPEGGLGLEFEWDPIIYAISDGTDSVKALFYPETYGDSPVYSVEGIYIFADGSPSRQARIYFQEGEMSQIFGFTGEEDFGAPHEITPTPGDQFTVLEQGIDLTGEEQLSYSQPGETLTFGETPFFIEEIPAPSGNYILGIIAEDLEGNISEQYEGLFVLNEEATAIDGFLPYVNEEMGFALLHPESWFVSPTEGMIDIIDEESSAIFSIFIESFPDVESAEEANILALELIIDSLREENELENLEFITETPEDFILGAFEAKIIDFTYELNGEQFYDSVIASTPVPDITYIVFNSALDSEFDAFTDEFDAMILSFDILISGVSKKQPGPPPPEFDEILFYDDYSDADSGLLIDETPQEWGQGFYDLQAETYTLELQPNSGVIYDYYADETLSDTFMLEITTSSDGAVDNLYGLIFQVTEGDTFDNFYSFTLSGDGFYTVEKTVDEGIESLIGWTPSDLITQEENILTILGEGDRYTLYINGQAVDSFTDADYQAGSWGIIADNFDTAVPATFTFDDLTVGTPVQ